MIELRQSQHIIHLRAEAAYAAEVTVKEQNQKAQLLSDLGNALEFPDYYGHNLDALDECLKGLCWLEPFNVLLTIRNFGKLEPGLRESITEICNDAEAALLPEKRLIVIAIE